MALPACSRIGGLRDHLTDQELQIAEAAATGLSNREIGQRLYLSHRTVESHLDRIFPKLGSRLELSCGSRSPTEGAARAPGRGPRTPACGRLS